MSSSLPTEWSDMPLDPRILEALKDLGWRTPTAVQGACVPLALRAKDISIQSRTGSGKTGAFIIPIVQRILTERQRKVGKANNPVALILVPSIELCEQTVEAAVELAKYVKPRLAVDNLTRNGAITAARVQAAHILVSTAAHLAKVTRSGIVTPETMQCLRFLVVDEADMLMSMAETSMRAVQTVLPATVQVILSSATLSKGVAAIKGQLLHNPVSIVLTDKADELLEENGAAASSEAASESRSGPVVESRITLKDPLRKTLKQYYLIATDECHRHTLLFALYRMSLIHGETLIFVEEDEDTYKLQHFLEQLGVATLVYDPNLPVNVRLDALRRFQSGAVSTLVCTDGTLESAEQLQTALADDADGSGGRKRRRPDSAAAAPSALHRGVDFSQVRNVILFDGVDALSPIALSRYTHRIGRAGRAGREGLSIAFFTLPQAKRCVPSLKGYARSRGDVVRPFKQMQRTDAAKLQYRVDSVLANVTRSSTRKLRVATVAAELSRSSYLSNHMNQKDTEALQRVVRRSERKVRVEHNLLELPDYMGIKKADDVVDYTKRVQAGQTRAKRFREVTRPASVDPLKAVASRLKASRGAKA